MQTDIIGVTIGILGIVIGVVVSYYFYRKSLRTKEPVYSIKSNNLISGTVSTLENLNISYKDYKVQNLTVSKILLYNQGAETITRQDIETKNRLTISSETCTFLDVSILQANNYSNNVEVTLNPLSGHIVVDFDYLDKNQGVVIQVIHDGLSSRNIEIRGDIRGVGKLTEVSPEKFVTKKSKEKFRNQVLYLGGLFVLIIGISWFVTQTANEENFSVWIGALIALFLGAVVSMLFENIFSIPRLGLSRFSVPKGLEKFIE